MSKLKQPNANSYPDARCKKIETYLLSSIGPKQRRPGPARVGLFAACL